MGPDHGPAAQITVEVDTVPRASAYTRDVATVDVDPGDRALRGDAHAHRPCGRRIAEHDRIRSGVPVAHADRRRQHIVDVGQRRQPPGLGGRQHAAGHTHRVLQVGVLLEHGDIGGIGEQEEVAHLLQADVGARTIGEALEGIHRPQRQSDVDLIGELQSHSPGRLRRRPARQLIRLEQQHIGDTGLGEVEGRARAHHPAADDHHLGTIRKRSIRRHTVSECDRSARSDTTRRRHDDASLCRILDFRTASRAS